MLKILIPSKFKFWFKRLIIPLLSVSLLVTCYINSSAQTTNSIYRLAYNPIQNMMAHGLSSNEVEIWDLATNSLMVTIPSPITIENFTQSLGSYHRIDVNSSDNVAIDGLESIVVWDINNGTSQSFPVSSGVADCLDG